MISDKTEAKLFVRKKGNQTHYKHGLGDLESEAERLNLTALSISPANSSFLGSGFRAVGISPAEASCCLRWVWCHCHSNHVSDSHQLDWFQSNQYSFFVTETALSSAAQRSLGQTCSWVT